MSTQAGLNIVTDGLELQIDAANKLGGNITDTNNIVNPTDLGTFVNGLTVVDGEFDFDGVDDYLDLGLFFNNHSDTMTLSFWVKHNTLAPILQFLFYKRDTSNADFACGLVSSGGNFVDFGFSGGTTSVKSTSYPSVDTWYNVVCTVNFPVTKSIYYNGVLEDTNTSARAFQNVLTEPFVLGARKNDAPSTGYSYHLNGQMKGINVWNRVLTAAEISQNYEASKHRFE